MKGIKKEFIYIFKLNIKRIIVNTLLYRQSISIKSCECIMGRLAELAGDNDSNEKSRTFVFQDEGHTLGNVLRSIIAHYPDVEFCGYTVPHPAESKMHFRIQAKKGRAVDILRRGLEDLSKVCDHTIETFEKAMDCYKNNSKMDIN